MVLGVAVAAAEWLRAPSAVAAWVAASGCVVACLLLVRVPRWVGLLLALPLAMLAIELLATQRRLVSIERNWPAEREARIRAYGERIGGELRAALQSASRLAEVGASVAGASRQDAFRALESAIPDAGVERGVAILDSVGAPWAWAGRHRLAPEPAGDSLAARHDGYYVILETRRHSAGRIVVASVLIWADSAVADRGRSVAERFRRQTEVGLLVHPPGGAPGNNTDIFDYFEGPAEGARLLFSVQPVAPTQEQARARVLDRGATIVLALTLVVLLLSLILASSPLDRTFVLPALLWLSARAPVGELLGLAELFSPTTSLTGAILTAGTTWLWLKRPPWFRPDGMAGSMLALLAAIAAPLIIARLGQDISAPAGGASLALWLTWQAALLLAAAPLAFLAAACRRDKPRPRRHWRVALGIGLAVGFSAIAVVTWQPDAGWPRWLPLLWTLPLLLVTLPAPRSAVVPGIAIVLGSLAALMSWSADARGRTEVAESDIGRLGLEVDGGAAPRLQRLALTAAERAPESAADLYALWRGSALQLEGYPAQLALWSNEGELRAELSLDSLALPPETISGFARALPADSAALDIRSVPAVPGIHQVLAQRVGSEAVMTVAVGPRSALVAPDRLGRLLSGEARGAAPYRLMLGSPVSAVTAGSQALAWRRTGWTLRSERAISLPGGARDVHAAIELHGAAQLAVRGTLVLLFDLMLLAVLWGLAAAAAGERPFHPSVRRLGRSFRLRLALALAAFFVIPTVAFAAWSFAHFGDEAERGRDLLITQTLRDAVQRAGTLLRTPGVPVTDALRGLSERVDADLALYRGGALVAASAPVLRDLGVVGPLMDPRAFQALALGGELELTREGVIPTLAERVGYRVIEFGPSGGFGVLVTPQVSSALDPGRQQLELALVLLLTTIVGIVAAVGGAGVAARALSRPVADLRRAALAVGQGKPVPLPSETPPVEFEPVFGAFQRMASDVRSSQRALEESRRRTAAVLATVATGVVALDPAGRVLIANGKATELLRVPLPEGEPFFDLLTDEWAPLHSAVAAFLSDPASRADAIELSVGGRRVTLEMAPLGLDVSGIVLALSDVTDLSRAERVLAWGEMAHQVAHEIKNPLTPMRLGIQHLQRAYRDRRGDFERTLTETGGRILAEIDRLDTIARAFSRFAAPAEEAPPLARVDLSAIAGEVVQFYGLAGEGAAVTLEAPAPVWALARRDEVKEVLVNLLENARNAGARSVALRITPGEMRIEDDGAGIVAELLPRIFEPRFSTTTSGSGLGLAIVKRLVESWGGTVVVTSEAGGGTVVSVRLPPAIG